MESAGKLGTLLPIFRCTLGTVVIVVPKEGWLIGMIGMINMQEMGMGSLLIWVLHEDLPDLQ